MAGELRTTTVRVFNQELRIRTGESEAFVEEVSRFVDETTRGIAAQVKTGTPTQIAVLASLNIAEELFRERRDGTGSASAQELERRMHALIGRLEEIVPPETARAPRPAIVRSGAGG